MSFIVLITIARLETKLFFLPLWPAGLGDEEKKICLLTK